MKHVAGFLVALAIGTNAVAADAWFTTEVTGGQSVIAATINQDGDSLGQVCFYSTVQCLWSFAMDSACEQGTSYPAMLKQVHV